MEMTGQYKAPADLPTGREPPVPFEQEVGWVLH
jgi:hypothetical protein